MKKEITVKNKVTGAVTTMNERWWTPEGKWEKVELKEKKKVTRKPRTKKVKTEE